MYKDSAQRSQGLYPHQDLWDYMLLATPDADIIEKIAEEQKQFFIDHGLQLKDPKPLISIANFSAKEAMEPTLVRWIQNVCSMQAPLELRINNFNGIPSHAIYFRITESKAFRKLVNGLKIIDGFIQSNDCPPIQLAGRAFLPLASGLPALVYEAAIKEYAQKTFAADLRIERLVLMKSGVSGKQQLVNSFFLQSSLTLPH